MSTPIGKALQIFHSHQGILRTRQAISLGIAPRTLYAMRDQEIIRQISRGVYQLAEREPLSNPDLVQIALRIPNAVICLISALDLYDLTSQIPHQVFIALPRLAEKPRLDYPPLNITWLSQKVYSSGITKLDIDGFSIKVYSKEKTIADCFKFRHKIGIDVAIEALKEYITLPDRQIDQLFKYARLDRVDKLVTRYLEVLV